MTNRRHSRRAVVRRGIVMAVEAVIVTAVMLGAMALIGWVATMATGPMMELLETAAKAVIG